VCIIIEYTYVCIDLRFLNFFKAYSTILDALVFVIQLYADINQSISDIRIILLLSD